MKTSFKTLKSSTIPVLLFAGILGVFALGTTGPVSEDSDALHAVVAPDGERVYEGVGRCQTCHKKPEQGEQFGLWEESQHSKAYETLAGPEAAEIAAGLGIENAQEADACLKCHVTGHGVAAEFLGKRYAVEDGVGCESCHGAGGDYYKKKTMIAIYKGEEDGAALGLVTPDETVCTGCHNDESPTFEAFDFEEASEKIAHPIPEERKAEYQ